MPARSDRWRRSGLTWADRRSNFSRSARVWKRPSPTFITMFPPLWITCFSLLMCWPGSASGSPNKCDEVRKLFQHTQVGSGQLLTLSPRAGMLGPWVTWYESFSTFNSQYICHYQHWLFIFKNVFAPSPAPVACVLSFKGFLKYPLYLVNTPFWTRLRGVCAFVIMTHAGEKLWTAQVILFLWVWFGVSMETVCVSGLNIGVQELRICGCRNEIFGSGFWVNSSHRPLFTSLWNMLP